MAKIEHRKFKNSKELIEFINSTFTHYNNFIFRGHADANWKLESSLARTLNSVYPKRKDIELLISDHLTSFRFNIRGKANINLKNISENDLWALGQHFGLYTPLLDFTKSAYVALFFALQGESSSGQRCIWSLSEHEIDEMNKRQAERNLLIEKVMPYSNNNSRLISQQGLFLKLPLNCSLDEMIKKNRYKGKGVPFFKLVFNDQIRDEMLLILQNMNINQLTLFPDLTGSALQSNYTFSSEPYVTMGRSRMWEDHLKRAKKRKK